MSRSTPAKTNAVPTASPAGRPTMSRSAGTVKLPPPTPVSPTAKAMKNPSKRWIIPRAPRRCGFRIPVFSHWRLLYAQSGKPDLEVAESLHQGLHFAQLAALGGVRPMENSEIGFLLFHGLLWKHVGQVERPFLGHAIAILVGLLEVITGIQEQNGNFRQPCFQHAEHDHVLRLEAAGHARPRLRVGTENYTEDFLCTERFNVR